jgi:hypothetical protein
MAKATDSKDSNADLPNLTRREAFYLRHNVQSPLKKTVVFRPPIVVQVVLCSETFVALRHPADRDRELLVDEIIIVSSLFRESIATKLHGRQFSFASDFSSGAKHQLLLVRFDGSFASNLPRPRSTWLVHDLSTFRLSVDQSDSSLS